MNLLPDENSHGLGTRQEPCKKNVVFSDGFGLRKPVIQETFMSDEKRATSIVARVLSVSEDWRQPWLQYVLCFGCVFCIPHELRVY